MNVIIRPIITEKTLNLAETENQFTFEVSKDTNKIEVRKAIEEKFGVHVTGVTMLNRLGKQQAFGRTRRIKGRKESVKRAVVTLKTGDNIGIFKLK